MLKEVIGMRKKKSNTGEESVNGDTFKVVEVINRNEFVVDCDTTQFTEYERNGMAKQVKV